MSASRIAGALQSQPSGRNCWSETFAVRSYDVDYNKRASAEAICRCFLEAAWNHAEQLGFGYSKLARQNRFWVLARFLLEIDAFPTWGEPVELRTWPRGIRGALALRDFEVCQPSGKRLAAGSSSWLILDLQTRKPQRLDKLLTPVANEELGSALGRDAARLSTQSNSAVALTTVVRYSDIDVNGHVNSATYVRWLLDAYSPEHHRGHALRRLEINYLGETHWGETVSVQTHQRAALEFAQSITQTERGEVCRAELLWDPVREG